MARKLSARKFWRLCAGLMVICPECGDSKSHRLDSRNLYQCASCRQQTSLTASTIFEHTKLPLSIWFRAICHLTQSKNGVLAMELMRRLGVELQHRLDAQAEAHESEARTTLPDRVEIDDAYNGGERSGGKVGRGGPGKTPFVATIQTEWQDKTQRKALH